MSKNKFLLVFSIFIFCLFACEQKANQVVQIITNPNEQSANNKVLPVKESSPPLNQANTASIPSTSQQSSPIPTSTPKPSIPKLETDFVKQSFLDNFDTWVSTSQVLFEILSIKILKDAPNSDKACSIVTFMYKSTSYGPDGPTFEEKTATTWRYVSNKWLVTGYTTRNGYYGCSSYKWPQ